MIDWDLFHLKRPLVNPDPHHAEGLVDSVSNPVYTYTGIPLFGTPNTDTGKNLPVLPVLTFLKYRYYTGPGIAFSIPNWKHYLLTQIAWNKKWLLILDSPEHVDSENIKFKIGCGSFLYQPFSKCDF
jgi:hypothetical protein